MNTFRLNNGLFYRFFAFILHKPRVAYLLLLTLLLAGCTIPNPFPPDWSFSSTDESHLVGEQSEPVGELSNGVIVSQSFMPNRDGLHRITLSLATYEPDAPHKGQVTFTLRDHSGDIVYQEHFLAEEVEAYSHRLFLFPPQPDSALRLYTVQLSADSLPGEAITPLADTTDRYPGFLDKDTEYLSGDLLMEWGYKPTAFVLLSNTIDGIRRHGLTMLLTFLLWTLPGLALLSWWRQPEDEAWSIQQLGGTALALSGALLVILPQYTHLVGIKLGGWAVWVLLLLSGGSLLLARLRGRSLGPIMRRDGITALYGALFVLLVASRFVALHSLWGPQWGDSVHHALITQLLLDNGGIFENYNPYLPLAPFTYHAGFHLLCAWVAWAVPPGGTELDGTSAILLGAQWLNVVAIMMVGLLAEGLARWRYDRQGEPPSPSIGGGAGGGGRPLAIQTWRVRDKVSLSQWAGVIALLIAGLLSEMPGFYVNWGRYTQLAGQIFLPPALLWSIRSWQPNERRRWLLLTVLMVSALALTHYRVLIMYAVTLPLLLAFAWWRSRLEPLALPRWRKLFGRAVASGFATCLLILPWYWRLAQSFIVQRATAMATKTGQPEGFIATYNAFGDITVYVPEWFLFLCGLALLWLLLRRQASGLLQAGWIGLFFLLANPYLLRLPGTGLVNNFMLHIALYLPLAALVGVGGADFADSIPNRIPFLKRMMGLLAALGILLLGMQGTWEQIHQTDPNNFSMITHSDLQATRWIKENTSQDAIFHINGFFAFADSVVAGSDGGWWLGLTARRQTTAPPQIYGHESGIDPEYRLKMNARYRRFLEAYQESPESLAAAMRAEKVDYVYIGAQQGGVDSYPLRIKLDPMILRNSPAFESVYSDDLTWIFKVR
ncbi:MAG: hypothetical protein ACPGWR_26265 [Ardenticatenaceae bacterium]